MAKKALGKGLGALIKQQSNGDLNPSKKDAPPADSHVPIDTVVPSQNRHFPCSAVMAATYRSAIPRSVIPADSLPLLAPAYHLHRACEQAH